MKKEEHFRLNNQRKLHLDKYLRKRKESAIPKEVKKSIVGRGHVQSPKVVIFVFCRIETRAVYLEYTKEERKWFCNRLVFKRTR